MGEIFERPAPAEALEWTGERLAPGAGKQTEVEHLHRYLYARTLCRGLDVLDVASGEGYGSRLLAQVARSVVGIELDADTVAHAAAAYAAPNLRFQQGDARRLPLPDQAVDAVVSFETLEHFYEHDLFMAEVRRVLRPAGRLIISSPEADVYSPAGQPANPYHVRELTRAGFAALLGQSFGHVVMLGQRPMLGSTLVAEGASSETAQTLTYERRGEHMFEASEGLPRPVYLLAVASAAPLPDVGGSLYFDSHLVEPPHVDPGLPGELLRVKATLVESTGYARHVEQELARSQAALKALRDGPGTPSVIEEHLPQSEIDRLWTGLGVRDRIIKERSRTIENMRAERIAFTEQASAELAQADALLAEHASTIGDLQARLGEYRDAVDRLQQETDHRAFELHTVLTSSSWRITRPVRTLLHRNRFVRRWTRQAAKLLRSPAGAAPNFLASPLASPSRPLALPAAAAAPPPSNGVPFDFKSVFTSQARTELAAFLTSGDRLSFPSTGSCDVSVVIVLWNQAHLTLRCLRALLAQGGPVLDVILVDNASTDDTAALLARVDGVRVLARPGNDGFIVGCNLGAAAARGRAVLLLNNDAVVQPGAIAAALATLDSGPDIGAVGGKLVLPSGLLQEGGQHHLVGRQHARLWPRRPPGCRGDHVPPRDRLLLRRLPADPAQHVAAARRPRRGLPPCVLRGGRLLHAPA